MGIPLRSSFSKRVAQMLWRWHATGLCRAFVDVRGFFIPLVLQQSRLVAVVIVEPTSAIGDFIQLKIDDNLRDIEAVFAVE
jgi:hypothetical protein